MNTVRAACALDYPSERYRVIVLDDGRSEQVHDSVNSLVRENRYKSLHYTSRNIKVRAHSRAANLNFGLDYVASLANGPSDYIAVLDSDMIALPYWLRAMLSYIVRDERVALANPAQRFYNIPDRDPFVQNLDCVFDGIETIKDCVQASWCMCCLYSPSISTPIERVLDSRTGACSQYFHSHPRAKQVA